MDVFNSEFDRLQIEIKIAIVKTGCFRRNIICTLNSANFWILIGGKIIKNDTDIAGKTVGFEDDS